MSTGARRAIQTRADIEQLVAQFYERLLADPRIAPLFAELDLDVHLPILADFWAMILLSENSYRRNAFQKHVPLAIESGHFEIWLGHFDATVDGLFTGEKADLAKERAHGIAALFRSKLLGTNRPA